jgi:hypothetical protein
LKFHQEHTQSIFTRIRTNFNRTVFFNSKVNALEKFLGFQSNFAGTATLPLLSESIAKVADIVVSKSEAETVNTL